MCWTPVEPGLDMAAAARAQPCPLVRGDSVRAPFPSWNERPLAWSVCLLLLCLLGPWLSQFKARAQPARFLLRTDTTPQTLTNPPFQCLFLVSATLSSVSSFRSRPVVVCQPVFPGCRKSPERFLLPVAVLAVAATVCVEDSKGEMLMSHEGMTAPHPGHDRGARSIYVCNRTRMSPIQARKKIL